jgi:hypothetical protein
MMLQIKIGLFRRIFWAQAMTAARKFFIIVILNVIHRDVMARVLPSALPANTTSWTSMTLFELIQNVIETSK